MFNVPLLEFRLIPHVAWNEWMRNRRKCRSWYPRLFEIVQNYVNHFLIYSCNKTWIENENVDYLLRIYFLLFIQKKILNYLQLSLVYWNYSFPAFSLDCLHRAFRRGPFARELIECKRFYLVIYFIFALNLQHFIYISNIHFKYLRIVLLRILNQ